MTAQDKPSSASTNEGDSSYAMVRVPAHLLDKVLARVQELSGDDDDVAGLMMYSVMGSQQTPIDGRKLKGGTGPFAPPPPPGTPPTRPA
jgi:hypothetical protein